MGGSAELDRLILVWVEELGVAGRVCGSGVTGLAGMEIDLFSASRNSRFISRAGARLTLGAECGRCYQV